MYGSPASTLGRAVPAALDDVDALLEVGVRVAELAAQDVHPAGDGAQRRAQLVRQRGQELVLHEAGLLGRQAGGALAFQQLVALVRGIQRRGVQARVVDGDGGLGGDAFGETLAALGEDADIRVPEEQPAEHVARAADDRHRQVAAHRQVACRLAMVRGPLAVAWVGRHVVEPDGRLAAERGGEQRRGPRVAQAVEVASSRSS